MGGDASLFSEMFLFDFLRLRHGRDDGDSQKNGDMAFPCHPERSEGSPLAYAE
jgi:hypothetical protein